jgi:asparagine synthase (glutamine-hydrolysing)
MCGLTFLHDPGADQATLIRQTRLALDRMAHRGPDDEGIWCHSVAALGHRRLAVIDLHDSRQPMLDPGQRYALAYNGEIYNFRELRRGLATKWSFRTDGDTEVLLAGLILEGEDFLARAEGMWALAFWDRHNHSLLLARDRMGKKPLFYRQAQQQFACASELSALARLNDQPWREDLNSTADYLRYGYYLPGTTAYRDVREVLPGHVLHWSPGHAPQQRCYWAIAPGGYRGSREQAIEELHGRLIHAVRQRMVADVPVGAFLSGGVDSSLITAIMVKDLGLRPDTFTIGFREAAYDERQFASLVAEQLGTHHHEQVLRHWDRDNLLKLILGHVGQPFTDSSILPTALVANLAARHVKVALSGDGGDELFSGYQRYQARQILRWYTRLPAAIRNNLERVIRAIPEPMAHHSRSVLKKAHLFLDVAARHQSEIPYVAPVLYPARLFDQLAPALATRGHAPPGLPEEARLDSLQEMMVADASVYLPQDILVKVDRAAMAHSLETRAPLLDSRVVQLAFSLPRPWHRRWFSGKHMLRRAFADYLPNRIWQRRKQGFGVPIHDWFRADVGEELLGLLASEKDTPLNHDGVRQLLDEHRSRKRDHGHRLWSIYIYLLWKTHGTCPAS